MFQQAVNACNTHVVQRLGAIAHHARGQERFFCHGNVTSSRRDNVDLPLARDFAAALDGDHSRKRMKFRRALRGRICAPYSLERRAVGTSDENILPAGFLAKHSLNNLRDLFGRLPFSKDDLGVALPQRAMMIHFRKTQILKGKMLQTSNGALRRHRPEAHEVQ